MLVNPLPIAVALETEQPGATSAINIEAREVRWSLSVSEKHPQHRVPDLLLSGPGWLRGRASLAAIVAVEIQLAVWVAVVDLAEVQLVLRRAEVLLMVRCESELIRLGSPDLWQVLMRS